MAAINGKITMSTCEGRPCWVDGRRAIFHRWTDSARPVKPVSSTQDTDERLQKWSVHGLVEYEDGTVEREWPSKIRFADSREYFDSLAWEEMEPRRDAMDDQATTTTIIKYADDRPVVAIHEENGQQTVECNPNCETCAHCERADIVAVCREYDFDCTACLSDCICRTCEDSNKWEPKEAAHR